ncbi:hypothetical protein C8035_v007580 [Colletotrichum spinosum]|uniref:Uncharacterized protein n=1 Tax=Colletotrichum spinosum TaxID=1347390 RepID=A0A4R8Q428_9PEZI|nr:hypothetical protein C8035_v007580 [Colletotrichum spinosum]
MTPFTPADASRRESLNEQLRFLASWEQVLTPDQGSAVPDNEADYLAKLERARRLSSMSERCSKLAQEAATQTIEERVAIDGNSTQQLIAGARRDMINQTQDLATIVNRAYEEAERRVQANKASSAGSPVPADNDSLFGDDTTMSEWCEATLANDNEAHDPSSPMAIDDDSDDEPELARNLVAANLGFVLAASVHQPEDAGHDAVATPTSPAPSAPPASPAPATSPVPAAPPTVSAPSASPAPATSPAPTPLPTPLPAALPAALPAVSAVPASPASPDFPAPASPAAAPATPSASPAPAAPRPPQTLIQRLQAAAHNREVQRLIVHNEARRQRAALGLPSTNRRAMTTTCIYCYKVSSRNDETRRHIRNVELAIHMPQLDEEDRYVQARLDAP